MPLLRDPLQLLFGGAVKMTVDFRPLQKVFLDDMLIKLLLAHKIIMNPILLPLARGAGGVANRDLDIGVLCLKPSV